jgi:hypothetical protein
MHRPGVAYHTTPYYARRGMANQYNGQIVSQLRATLNLLSQADHDYQGHRARAMHAIGSAMNHLQPRSFSSSQYNLAAPTVATPAGASTAVAVTRTATNGPGRNQMPQATSDAHLQNALQSLNGIQGELTNTGGTQHHVRARQAVQLAIQELNTALSIR